MDKKRIEIIITAVLVLVLIFVWANNINIFRKRAVQKTPSLADTSVNKLKLPSMQAEEIYPRKSQGDARDERLAWVRDPFSGKIYTSGEGSHDLKLDGIIWDKKDSLAMINNRIVRVGEEIGENKVIDIKPDRVILSDGTKDFELKLEE